MVIRFLGRACRLEPVVHGLRAMRPTPAEIARLTPRIAAALRDDGSAARDADPFDGDVVAWDDTRLIRMIATSDGRATPRLEPRPHLERLRQELTEARRWWGSRTSTPGIWRSRAEQALLFALLELENAVGAGTDRFGEALTAMGQLLEEACRVEARAGGTANHAALRVKARLQALDAALATAPRLPDASSDEILPCAWRPSVTLTRRCLDVPMPRALQRRDPVPLALVWDRTNS